MNHTKIITLLCLFLSSMAQSQTSKDSTDAQLKVFLNCGYCYNDYLKTEITWVDFVQDQFVADVDLLVAPITTGSGGTDYKLTFTGKKAYTGMADTLRFTVNAINTEGEIREKMGQYVKLGLVRYAMRAGLTEKLLVTSRDTTDQDDIGIGSNPENDPWNAWVFNINGNLNLSAEKIFQSGFFNGNISARQIKEDHKLRLNVGMNYSEQRFTIDDIEERYVLRGQNGSANYVHSVNDHWSAGVFTYFNRSVFSNYDYFQNAALSVEYDIFPYNEAQSKLITFQYNIGATYFDFEDTTIFDQTKLLVPTQNFNIGASFTQTWGSLSSGAFAASFLNDFSKYRYGGWLNADVRIFKGLSLSTYMSYNVIRDQVNLRKGGASDEDILLQQRELATSFNFYTYFGISYRFGSIYNNVVNPRFDYGG